MKKSIIYILLLVAVAGASSCKKFVEVDPPQNQLVSELVFQNDQTADAAVAGIYSRMNAYNGGLNVNGSVLPGFGANDFYYAFSTASYDEFTTNSLTPGNSQVNSFWEGSYSLIYQANSIIEGLTASNKVSPAVKKSLLGEAQFIRGFFYFYLVNFFGDVPLILNTNYKVNTLLPRESKDKVWTAIINDFKDAQSNLSTTYSGSERIRANQAAASTMLARAYLYTEKWDLAETEAGKVIQDPQYRLVADLNKVFLKGSQEAILQLQTVNTSTTGVNTWEGFSIVPTSPTSRGYYNLTPELLNAFETNDNRRRDWVNTYVTSGTTFYYPYKYKIRTKSPVEEYSMVLRLAEVYLIRAEARAQQSKLSLAKADLDTIRSRANLPALASNLTKPQTLLAVEQERNVELFTEWGHRWFDLRRTGRALTVLATAKPNLTATGLWYPIPQSARNSNPNLTQNDGYF